MFTVINKSVSKIAFFTVWVLVDKIYIKPRCIKGRQLGCIENPKNNKVWLKLVYPAVKDFIF